MSLLLQEKLSKTVNMRAMNMLGKAEERVREGGGGAGGNIHLQSVTDVPSCVLCSTMTC